MVRIMAGAESGRAAGKVSGLGLETVLTSTQYSTPRGPTANPGIVPITVSGRSLGASDRVAYAVSPPCR